jgi:hypothetical protein
LTQGTLSNLNKHHRAVGFLQNEVNFTTATAGRSIIAYQQTQALLLQKEQRGIFRGIARLLTCPIREHH